MDKYTTDFALMASAFSKDHKMATQICRLLTDGDVTDAIARKMLKLVIDGKLASEIDRCVHWHYSYSTTYYPSFTLPSWYSSATGDLVSMAQNILSENTV